MGALNKIIILHGWTHSLDKWEGFVKFLRNLGFDAEVLKIPGLTEKSDEVWNLGKYSKWLNNQLSKESGKVILLGHSNGGRIAAFFAAKHSDKVQKLTLIDSAGVYHKELPLQIKRFIFMSSDSVLLKSPGQYAQSKIESEKIVIIGVCHLHINQRIHKWKT